MKALRKLFIAAAFVTCIPLSEIPPESDSDLMWGLSKFLPLVGGMIGIALCGLALALTSLHAGALLAATVLSLAWLFFTGGIHFDGLMDTADGIFSHRDTERMLEIMQDSRVGNFGVLTGMSVMLVKIAALATLPLPALYQALVTVPVCARFCEAMAIGCFAYLRDAGMGKVWHDTTRAPRDLVLAGALPAAIVACALSFGYAYPVFLAAATIASGLFAGAWLNAILKGHTGDTYGCVVELAEAGGLLIAALTSLSPPISNLVLPA